MIKILIADEIDLTGIKKLSRNFFVTIKFGISDSEIIKFYGDYDVLVIRSTRKIDKNFLEKTFFKVIATCSKGIDHIDITSADKKYIKIINDEEGNHISAAEHTLALILSIHKNLILSDRLVRDNKFTFYNYQRNELFGKQIGIIGFGKVGSYVGKLCKAFGMQVYANDIDKKVRMQNRNFDFKSLKFIFKNCQIISLHIPLNKKNFHFLSKDRMKLLKKDMVLINTSRGNIIDEKYFLKSLKNKNIKYAGLDVFSNEPEINKDFRKLDNLILSNHIAGKTQESSQRISENIFRQIEAVFNN